MNSVAYGLTSMTGDPPIALGQRTVSRARAPSLASRGNPEADGRKTDCAYTVTRVTGSTGQAPAMPVPGAPDTTIRVKVSAR